MAVEDSRKNGENLKGNERVMQFILMTAKDILAAL